MKKTLIIGLGLILFSCSNSEEKVQNGTNQTIENSEETTQKETEPKIAVNYIDGSPIRYVVVGDQIWTSSNLDVTQFKNGDPIEKALGKEAWKRAGKEEKAVYTSPGNGGDVQKNGLLYNWFTISDSRGICPEGWHVPKTSDWEKLKTHLGDQPGKKVKSSSDWMPSSETGKIAGNNESGLNVFPAGVMDYDGRYISGNSSTVYFTSKIRQDGKVEFIDFSNLGVGIDIRYGTKPNIGVSCRCIKNDSDITILPKENRVFPDEKSNEVIMNEYEAAEMGDEAEYVEGD